MMNILIPLNSLYLRKRYNASFEFLELLSKEVLPQVLDRFSADERVKSIEIISDMNLEHTCERYSKSILTKFDIGSVDESNVVVEKILAVRKIKSPIIVQANLLYPFISVNSLYRGFSSVKDGSVSSALASLTEIESESNSYIINKSDLGIFTVYRELVFKSSFNRVSAPTQMIGIRALEMISLRSEIDIELYELIINSGYEL